jgi:uncharacterized protein
MLNRKAAIDIINEFIESCNARGITFKKVILFGSAARNNAHKYSDIDIALVSESFSGMPYKDWSMLTPVKTSKRKFMVIEPHPFSITDFEEGDPFIDEIKRTGITVNKE